MVRVQSGSGGGGEKWCDSENILKIEGQELPTEWLWDIRERKESRSKVFIVKFFVFRVLEVSLACSLRLE